MKKLRRALCAMLAAVLMVFAVPAASSAADLYFMAVNDSIPMSLSSDTMPFYYGGVLYVPSSVFTYCSGMASAYVPSAGTVTVSTARQSLSYTIADATVTDENGSTIYMSVVVRGSIAFVPASYTARHFGLSVSYLTSAGGYSVVRFTNGNQVYDDSLFLEKADNLIEYRAAQYETPAAPSTDPTPNTPSVPDSPTLEAPANLPRVYLAFTGADSMLSALSALDGAGVEAAFFFTEAEIAAHPELVLRAAAAGHSIGVTYPAGTNDPAAAVRAANEALDALLQTKSLLVLQPSGAADSRTLSAAYRVFRTNSRTVQQALEATGPMLLTMTADRAAAAVRTLDDADAVFLQLRETSLL